MLASDATGTFCAKNNARGTTTGARTDTSGAKNTSDATDTNGATDAMGATDTRLKLKEVAK